MRVIATILVILSGVIGFVCSYEIAYKKITTMLNQTEARPQIAGSQTR